MGAAVSKRFEEKHMGLTVEYFEKMAVRLEQKFSDSKA